jgi:hypothetical protein
LCQFLNKEERDQYKLNFLTHTDHGFEVPMNDKERLDYMIYRTVRDIIRAKLEEAAMEKKDGKERKLFVNRVLNKAAEHLKK